MPSERPKLNPDRSPVHSYDKREDFKMGWDREFREMLRTNPGIVKTAIKLIDKALKDYSPPLFTFREGEGITMRYDRKSRKWMERWPVTRLDKKKGEWVETGKIREQPMGFDRGTLLVPGEAIVDKSTGLEVRVLGRSNRENMGDNWFSNKSQRRDICDYLRIKLGSKDYFVKRTYISINPGFTEFKDTEKAREVLRDLDYVKVVEAKLGYQDQNEGWFVSGWENLENGGFRKVDLIGGDDYGREIGSEAKGSYFNYPSQQEHDSTMEKAKEVGKRLGEVGIGGDLMGNLFYSPTTGNFILLDVSRIETKPKDAIGNPYGEDQN